MIYDTIFMYTATENILGNVCYLLQTDVKKKHVMDQISHGKCPNSNLVTAQLSTIHEDCLPSDSIFVRLPCLPFVDT